MIAPRLALAAALVLLGCSGAPPRDDAVAQARDASTVEAACSSGPPMTVTFYDAGQALAALVELPDGRHIMVDAGESPKRPGCSACRGWHERVMAALTADLAGRAIDMLWITHQHSDHLGGAAAMLEALEVREYVDNGLDLDKPTVAATRKAAVDRGVRTTVLDEDERELPIEGTASLTLTPVVPTKWPSSCKSSPNDCSIGLRIDYCQSSVLFVGDAEAKEEAVLPLDRPVTLLQVAHHGSDTSSSEAFIARARPRYAVVSSGKQGEGTNKTYCHPFASIVSRLNEALGAVADERVLAFDGALKCKDSGDENWRETPTSDRLWLTARDGHVKLVTHGDGTFERVPAN